MSEVIHFSVSAVYLYAAWRLYAWMIGKVRARNIREYIAKYYPDCDLVQPRFEGAFWGSGLFTKREVVRPYTLECVCGYGLLWLRQFRTSPVGLTNTQTW